MTGWLADAVQTPVADVAARFGREVRRSPSASSFGCPACGCERRHASRGDRRGACGSPHARPTTWRCFECGAGGDGVDFAAHVIGGQRFRLLASHHKDEVREWFRTAHGIGQLATRPRSAPTLPSHNYPDQHDVRTLWSHGLPVHRDRDCVAYLEHRGLDPRLVFDHDLAFALPWGQLPNWAACAESSWARSKHRLIVPLYDSSSVMRSVLGRSVERAPFLKSVAPAGFSRGQLVMANRVALAMLRGKARPDHVIIREGEIDYLAEASRTADAAVIGIVSGSWCAQFAARIPHAARVTIATDNDVTGDRYADAIAATLDRRVQYERRREVAA